MLYFQPALIQLVGLL